MSGARKLNGAEVLPPMRPPREPQSAPPGASKRRQAAGRFRVLNAFVDATLADLCRGDIAVWLVLFRDTRDGTARTSQADIARRAGLSDRGVRCALRRLERRGLLRCVYRGGLNRGASRYRVVGSAEPIDS